MKGLALVAASLLVTLAPAAEAQDTVGAAAPGFGKRSQTIFSIENLFGFASTSESQHDAASGRDASHSYDDKGFFPGLLGPRLALHGVSDGLTYGVILGSHWSKAVGRGSDTGGSLYVLSLGPRIGYAGSLPKQPVIGYWVRTGPTFMYVHTETGSPSRASNSGFLDWTFEAYGVVTPADHFGIFFGPSFDVAITGKSSDQDVKLTVLAIGAGLLADW